MIRVLYFASLRERLGRDVDELELPSGVADVAALLEHLRQRGQPWAGALATDQTLLVARNQEMAAPQTPLADGDEIGIFPPVTGG
jgi:molybdopterin synthase sulfur carrier subunit